jgi:hypothetical protein
MRIPLIAVAAACCLPIAALAEELPPGYWPPERTPEILDLTRTVRLAPPLAELTAGERNAVRELVEAGKLMQRIYEDSLHPQALSSIATLEQLAASSEHCSIYIVCFAVPSLPRAIIGARRSCPWMRKHLRVTFIRPI